MDELNDDWFGIDASDINAKAFEEGEYIIWFHPRYKSRPIKWFTAKQVEKLIGRGHAQVSKTTTDDIQNNTGDGSGNPVSEGTEPTAQE